MNEWRVIGGRRQQVKVVVLLFLQRKIERKAGRGMEVPFD
jgi:hypothetical protein